MIIYEGLKAVASSLNDSFRSSARWSGDKVVLSGLAEPDGNPPLLIENKLVLTLLGLDNESVLKNQRSSSIGFGNAGRSYPGYHFNMMVLMAAASPNYQEALKLLSDGISFVQAKPLVDGRNTPGIHSGLNKLTIETVPLSVEHLSHIWGAIGSKLMPSILYKIRVVAVEGNPFDFVPTISGEDLQNRTSG